MFLVPGIEPILDDLYCTIEQYPAWLLRIDSRTNPSFLWLHSQDPLTFLLANLRDALGDKNEEVYAVFPPRSDSPPSLDAEQPSCCSLKQELR